nr:MAG TPA: hypothetical protein [Caudoviricetes sp.]
MSRRQQRSYSSSLSADCTPGTAESDGISSPIIINTRNQESSRLNPEKHKFTRKRRPGKPKHSTGAPRFGN